MIGLPLLQVCTERGWREYTGDNTVFKDRWNLWWKSGGFSQTHYKSLLPWQVKIDTFNAPNKLFLILTVNSILYSSSIVSPKGIPSAEKTIS